MKTLSLLLFVLLALTDPGYAEVRKFPTSDELRRELGAKAELHLDQPYAGNANPRQMLDLYLPKQRAGDKPLPVVAYIHGGGWGAGDRKRAASMMAAQAASGNYAGVSIGYRLSAEASWPAQIHDAKAAIRWLRGHAKEFNFDPERIAVWGGSAGGHLVSLLGTSGEVQELEGDLGEFTKLSSRVSCVVNLCGPSDLTAPLRSGDAALQEDTAITGLLGGPLDKKRDLARAASPLTHVTPDDAPFLTAHGTKDERVNFSHAVNLDAALKKAGVPSLLIPIAGGGHGIQGGPELAGRIQQFLDLHLRGVKADISSEPIPTQTPPAK